MRRAMLVFILTAITALVGYALNPFPFHPGIQVNDSSIYISEIPIKNKDKVTFWYEASPEGKKILKETLAYRFDSELCVCTPQGEKPIMPGTVEVTDAKITRTVSVKQGDVVLYERKDLVTVDNLEDLCSWTSSSQEWTQAISTDKSILFEILYWRTYKYPVGNSGHFSESGNETLRTRVKVPIDGNRETPDTSTFMRLLPEKK
jgi:hypothetical protein